MQCDGYKNLSYRYYFLDFKLGDVTGDGYVDRVYLIGEKTSKQDLFSDNISIVIHDGRTNQLIRIQMKYAAGYNAKLFLGNFTSKKKFDMLVKIDTGGSGGYILSYLYSLNNGTINLLLDSESFERISLYDVTFLDDFNVEILSETGDVSFILSLLDRKDTYIKTDIYAEDGKLLKPTEGAVLALAAAYPIIDDYHGLFKLLTYQRIIGTDITDDLGAIESYLTWNGEYMEVERVNLVC